MSSMEMSRDERKMKGNLYNEEFHNLCSSSILFGWWAERDI